MELSTIQTDGFDGPVKRKFSDINSTVEDKKSSVPNTEDGAPKQNVLEKAEHAITSCVASNKVILRTARNVFLLLAYFGFFGYAMYYQIGDEESIRLLSFTIFGILLLSWRLLMKRDAAKRSFDKAWTTFQRAYSYGKRPMVFRWIMYVLMTIFMTVYLIVTVAIESPENMRSLIGIFGFPFLIWLYSNNRTKVNWHTVFWGMALQYVMALLFLKTSWGIGIIEWIGARLTEFIANSDAGAEFVFGETFRDHAFVFKSMPSVMLLLVGISVITYLGVVSFIVETVGWLLAAALQTTPAEGIFMVGTVFLHIPECAILILRYLDDMTPSQLFVVSAGALSTVGGTSIVIFMSSGIAAAPLIAASAMSAPAALAVAKLVFPSTDDEIVPEHKENSGANLKLLRIPKTLPEAVIVGINQSVSVIVQAVAYILLFISLLEFVNNTCAWFGDRIGVEGMTLEFIFSYVFYPFAFMMGARHEDCLRIGELLGIRTFSFAIIAFPKLGAMMDNKQTFQDYQVNYPNGTYTNTGNDVFLTETNVTLQGGFMDGRSEAIAIYSLCGSASVALLAFILGSFEIILPHRQPEIMKHSFRAMVAGTVASYMTACFAGLLYEDVDS